MENPDSHLIHPSSVVSMDAQIGECTRIWHFCHLMNCTVGNNCNIGQNVFIGNGVVIGNRVKIQNNVSLYTGVVCEDEVFIGPSVVFTNVINPRSVVERRHECRKTLVRQGASIGANATIVCGNEIGRYAMVGAGTVVVKPVKDYALVVGNPGRQIGWVSEHGAKLHFDGAGLANCMDTGECYQLKKGEVKKISE